MSIAVKSKIQKWGNGLGLRVSGAMRDVPHFSENTDVTVEIFADGFTVKKLVEDNKDLPYSEQELLQGLGPEVAQEELIASPTDVEWIE